MGKFLRSLTDGSLRCKYCGDSECLCMEDGLTKVGIVGVYNYYNKETKYTSTFVQFRKQVLPNGKKIPSGAKIYIPSKECGDIDEVLKTITLTNDFINKLRFD